MGNNAKFLTTLALLAASNARFSTALHHRSHDDNDPQQYRNEQTNGHGRQLLDGERGQPPRPLKQQQQQQHGANYSNNEELIIIRRLKNNAAVNFGRRNARKKQTTSLLR